MKILAHPETKVVLALLALLGLLELGTRALETRLSKDVAHLRSVPAAAARFQSAPNETLRVLILGNSLSRCGLDRAVLAAGLKEKLGREVVIEALTPDGSRVEEWLYGYRRYFDQNQAQPDVILLGTARLHLTDNPPAVDKLAAFYVSRPDLSGYLKDYARDVESASLALTARTSMLFAHRARVQPLVFYNLVPGYTETVQGINAQRAKSAAAHMKGASAPPLTCAAFDRLLSTAQASGTKVIVVTIPLPDEYVIPEEVTKTAQAHQTPIVLLGQQLRLPDTAFPDAYHLSETGAADFTRQLLEPLVPLLSTFR